MENKVSVDFDRNAIAVNNEVFWFDSVNIDTIQNVLPDNVKDKTIIEVRSLPSLNRIEFLFNDSSAETFPLIEENYNNWVKPYADMWQAEKDRLEQEQEEAEAEWNKFENRQARALTQLNADFETVKERSHLKSSLGFEVDANQTANENVNGLLITIGEGTCQFCDYYNQFHELNKSQLETLQSEIIQNAQSLYAQKWQYRTAIEQCSDNEGLDQVVAGIEFTYMDFTQTGDTGETVTE